MRPNRLKATYSATVISVNGMLSLAQKDSSRRHCSDTTAAAPACEALNPKP